MLALLDQLYKTKLQLIAVLAVVGGIALLMLAHWSNTPAAPSWLASLPIAEIGSTLFGTGLLAVFFEYVDRKHGDQRTDQRVRDAVRQEAPAIRDAVLDSFAFNADTLKDVASSDTLDRIAMNALGLRLDDQALAHEVYADLRDQVIRAPERWQDVSVDVALSPSSVGPATGRGSMFVATIRWEYRTTPVQSTMRFACVSDMSEYREMLRDQAITSAWHFESSSQIDASSPDAFELTRFSVDGKEMKIRRLQRRGGQTYSANLGNSVDAGKSVAIAYMYQVLVKRLGHMLYLDLPRPTKGVHIRLNYANADIWRINALDYFASSQSSRVEQASAADAAKTVNVGFDGWVFPRSGVAFVWVLEEEIRDTAKANRRAVSSTL